MKLFEQIPSELFSVLSSPNKELYADALGVLYTAYQDNLKLPEKTLYSMIRGKLEQQLCDMILDGEEIDEEERRDISGRARFLIRKLCQKGWFDKERGDDFEEYISVPGYSSQLLELFHNLTDDKPLRGYSYVFGTYSALKVADDGGSVYEKMSAVYSAYDNMNSLIKLLKMVYNDIKKYFKLQIEMRNINDVLATHFNDFGQRVVESYIKPLKIKDSVPKYRIPIQKILDDWLNNESLISDMSAAAFADKRGGSQESCRADLLEKIFYVRDHMNRVEHDYLDEIDRQVRRYTRATTQKIENLTSQDRNVRGNLNYLLTAISESKGSPEVIEMINSGFGLYEQSYLSERSLWYRKRQGERKKSEPVLIDDEHTDSSVTARAEELLRTEYGRRAISEYIKEHLSKDGICRAEDWNFCDDKAYVMNMLAVIHSRDEAADYSVEVLDGQFTENVYTVPNMIVRSKRAGTSR